MMQSDYYRNFQASTNRIKHQLMQFLLDAQREGKTVAAYGAAAKGNTLLNYAGIRSDLVAFVWIAIQPNRANICRAVEFPSSMRMLSRRRGPTTF